MRENDYSMTLTTAMRTGVLLLLVPAGALAQQQINLTAAPTNLTLPDGSTVPMWGYSCPTTQVAGSTATCAPLNPNAAGGWSPVLITVPTGQGLTVNLTNHLLFTPATPAG